MRTKPAFPPLDAETIERARAIAEQYRLLLDVDEQGVHLVTAMEMPRVLASAKTLDECVRKSREMLTVAVASLLRAGKSPPLPSSVQRRDEQINIRVSSEEKVRLEAVARQNGFRSVSDYIRRRALDGAA